MTMLRWAREALAIPRVYRVFSRAAGGAGARERFARELIRATSGQRVLDIGCGPADILFHLPGVAYTGFDASADYIEAAKRNHGDHGTFYCRRVDEAALDELGTFDVVLALGVLHHLGDEEAEQLFRIAKRALPAGGRLVTCDPVFMPGQPRVARFLISRDRGEHVRDEPRYLDIASRVFTKIRPQVRGDLNWVPYTHLVLECIA
jgi:SAM-dependent methyltransferase